MTREEMIAAAEREAAECALAAGPEAIMAGAADAEAGSAVLTDLLAHELAAGHRLMLRLADAANAVLDWSADAPEAADPDSADLAAGRLAAAASRLLEQLRQGLLTLRRLRPGAEGDGELWIALRWLGERCSAEELQRRLAAAKAARTANAPSPPALSERARAARDLAAEEAAELMAAARAGALAGAAADAGSGAAFLSRLLAHELGAAHALCMRLAGCAHAALDRAADAAAEPTAALRLAGVVARLGDRFRRGLLAVAVLAGAPDGKPRRVAGMVWGGADAAPADAAGAAANDAAPAAGTAATAGHGVLRLDSGSMAACAA